MEAVGEVLRYRAYGLQNVQAVDFAVIGLQVVEHQHITAGHKIGHSHHKRYKTVAAAAVVVAHSLGCHHKDLCTAPNLEPHNPAVAVAVVEDMLDYIQR